jgi:hypothetical protein
MEFIRGESRDQMILLPDSMDDYVDENNPVRGIEAYVNSLNLAELGFAKPQPHDTGRPMYSPKDLLKLYMGLFPQSELARLGQVFVAGKALFRSFAVCKARKSNDDCREKMPQDGR